MFYFAGVNLLAVLLASIANMVVGMLWYSPLMFGEVWMKNIGLDPKKMKMTPQHMIGAWGVGFLIAFGLAYVFNGFGVMNVVSACQVAFVLWLCFIATTGYSDVIWAGKSPTVYAINMGAWLVGMKVMTIVLTLFG